MQFIKSLIFNFFLFFGIIMVFILALPTLLLPNKFTLYCGKFLAYYIIFILKIILNCNVIFHGRDNLKKLDKFFIASAHQSMFETFVLQAPLNFPVFILKKELLKIPIFGWYLKKIGSIEIVRETTTRENLNFFEKIKKGVGRIYDSLKLPCVPIALNSGKVWPKNSFIKYSGDIHVVFLKPIMPGLEKEKFLNIVENQIYNEIEKYY